MRHPILPLFPEKFFADTADMTPAGAAFYLVLLAHAWVRGGSLPNDADKLRLMLRLTKNQWSRLRPEIMEKWTLGEDGRLHQKRMDEEWKRREQHTARAQDSASPKREMPFKNVHHVMAKKPTISTRARRPDPSPSPFIEEEETALAVSPPSRAHTRATPPDYKNGRGGKNGAVRKPSVAELARRKLEEIERREREGGDPGSFCHLQLIPKVRH